MVSSEGSEGQDGWILETIRATQHIISASTGTDEIGSQLPEAVVEPAVNQVAWIGQTHPDGGIRIRASSHPLPGNVALPGEVTPRTSEAADSGRVQLDGDDPEYDYLTDEYDIPTVERTVSIPLRTDAGSVLHLYTDGELPAAAAESFQTLGEIVRTGLERATLSSKLDRERARLEALRSLVSHDLGNPLNLAAGRLDLVSMECESEHIEHVEKGLDQIEQLADEGTMFVTIGREITDRETLSLTSIANDCWEYASSERGSLTVEETTVNAHPERLRRILNELFENMFAHIEGDIRAEIGPLADGEGFYVSDDGPGIPEDDREYIFDRGYTTDADRDGNGLAIVEEIVAAHDWELRVAETDGTRFEVRTDRW